jgi:hypothetical protein
MSPADGEPQSAEHACRCATDYSVTVPGPPLAIAKFSAPLTTALTPHQRHDGSEDPGGGAETTGRKGQSQPTDDHAGQC